MSAAQFNRPGVSDEFLAAAACHHIGADECVGLYGCRAEGIAIPFRSLDGHPIMDNGKPFARVRLYAPTETQKYHQRAGSQTHICIPPNFRDLPRGATLILTEGEFKALSLSEAGFCVLGLCGISGAMRNVDGEPRLNDELVEVLQFHKPARVLFLGDSDAILNSDFSREASKLHKVLFESKRFSFIQELRIAVCPLGGTKGVDDVRESMGLEFTAWFEALAESALVVESKATPAFVFCALIRRESAAIRKAVKGDDHDAHRYRVRLLQSAGRLQSETGAILLIKPLLSDLLNIKEGELSRMIKDSGWSDEPTIQSHTTTKPIPADNIWPHPVNGSDLLDALAGEFRKFLVLPPHADTVLALWTLHSYSWEQCEYSPIIAITSPVKSCGKSRVLDVLEKLASNAFRTGNMSEAVLFRVLDSRKPSVLIDEFDTIPEDRRDALSNILKHGFHRAGRVHRVEGEAKKEIVEFVVFGPKALACIKLSTLDGPTLSRCINIRMQRKKSSQKVARLRRYDGKEWKQKCLRWTTNNRAQIESSTAELPEALGDREQDIYEPLFVLANLAGGDWPERIRRAALALCGASADAQQDTAVMLLGWIQTYFIETGTDKVSSAALVHWLNERVDAPFASWSDGKGISQNEIRRHLDGFEIRPEVIRLDDEKTARGYRLDWFKVAFECYLAENDVSNCNSVTKPMNIDDNSVLPTVTNGECYSSENSIPTNKDGQCYSVTVLKPENTPDTEKEVMLL